MASKVIRIGNSTGISVPKADLAKLGLTVGDTVTLRAGKSRQRNSVTVVPTPRQNSADLAEWTDTFIEQYRPALEALAKK